MPPQNEVSVGFGEQITLIGYDLVIDGENIVLRPYWNAYAPPVANYSMFVHVYPAGEPSNIVAQWDGSPVSMNRLPMTWTDPDENLIGADVNLTLPANIAEGDLVLAVGLYNFETGTRLSVGESDRYELWVGRIRGKAWRTPLRTVILYDGLWYFGVPVGCLLVSVPSAHYG